MIREIHLPLRGTMDRQPPLRVAHALGLGVGFTRPPEHGLDQVDRSARGETNDAGQDGRKVRCDHISWAAHQRCDDADELIDRGQNAERHAQASLRRCGGNEPFDQGAPHTLTKVEDGVRDENGRCRI